MAKRVKVMVPREVTVRDCDLKLLDVIDAHSRKRKSGAMLSSHELAGLTGKSDATIHRAVGVCVERGHLEVSENRQANGAQLANSYVLTDEGYAVLSAARDQGLV